MKAECIGVCIRLAFVQWTYLTFWGKLMNLYDDETNWNGWKWEHRFFFSSLNPPFVSSFRWYSEARFIFRLLFAHTPWMLIRVSESPVKDLIKCHADKCHISADNKHRSASRWTPCLSLCKRAADSERKRITGKREWGKRKEICQRARGRKDLTKRKDIWGAWCKTSWEISELKRFAELVFLLRETLLAD